MMNRRPVAVKKARTYGPCIEDLETRCESLQEARDAVLSAMYELRQLDAEHYRDDLLGILDGVADALNDDIDPLAEEIETFWKAEQADMIRDYWRDVL